MFPQIIFYHKYLWIIKAFFLEKDRENQIVQIFVTRSLFLS